MPLTELENWKSKGHFIHTLIGNHQVFYREFGDSNASSNKTLLLLHGFPESSYSYHKVIQGLMTTFDRIVVFDMIGYGLSDKPLENYGYSLIEQADIALQVWKHLDIKGGHLLSHDMGDSVATELVARHVNGFIPYWFSDGFQSFTFTNGSMVLDLAKLRITQKLLLSRYGKYMVFISNYNVVKQQVTSAHGNDRLSENDIQLLWDNIIQQDGHRKTYLTIKYLNDRKKFEKTRWLPALKKVKLPVHLCWGTADSVAKVEMAHYLKKNICTNAELSLMPDVGHFCQIGSPEIWLNHVQNFYQKNG